jgi:hypothetical protein
MVKEEHKITNMTRRRTFWLTPEIDTALRVKAAQLNVRFSEAANIAIAHYLGIKIDKDKK